MRASLWGSICGGRQTVFLSDFVDLDDAVQQIGGVPTNLIVDVDSTVDTNVVVPNTMLLSSINSKKLTYASGGAISFMGRGLSDPTSSTPIFESFPTGGITWDGTSVPSTLSSSLWDTGNTSVSDRLERANDAVLGSTCRILADPNTITKSINVNEGHTIVFSDGEYPNTLDTVGTTGLPPFVMHDYTGLEGTANGAVIYQGPGNNGYIAYGTSLVQVGAAGLNQNISITGLTFRGGLTTAHFGTVSVLHLGNCHNATISNNVFDNVFCIIIPIGAYRTEGNYSNNVTVDSNVFHGCANQLVAPINAANVAITNNTFDQTDDNHDSNYSVVDCEPNTPLEYVSDVLIANNSFTFDQTFASSEFKSAITVQQKSERVIIRDNTIIGHEFDPVEIGSCTYLVFMTGSIDSEIYNNYGQCTISGGIVLDNCKNIAVYDNELVQIGDSTGHNAAISCVSVITSLIATNDISYGPIGSGFAGNIYESEQSKATTTSGSTVTSGATFPAFYDFWVGETVALDAVDYTVATIDRVASPQTLTTTTPCGAGSPTMATRFSSNVYDANVLPGTITLAPTGTSVII